MVIFAILELEWKLKYTNCMALVVIAVDSSIKKSTQGITKYLMTFNLATNYYFIRQLYLVLFRIEDFL